MNGDGEQPLSAWVYGQDPSSGAPGPRPGRSYVELAGGLLDGLLLDVTGWPRQEIGAGTCLRTERGQFGAGGRPLYHPRPGDPGRFDWSCDSP